MKILDLISGVSTAVTNEEADFINQHPDGVKIHALSEHGQWVAQNLVRKGIYSISTDNQRLINNSHETSNRKNL
jgi:hypothetical protein